MAISYKNRLIEFNIRKHKLILERALHNKTAKHYFVEADYDAIKKLSVFEAKYIWQNLVINIEDNGEWGISAETCSFCIYKRIFNMRCTSCEWGKNHGLCAEDSGDFKKLSKFFSKNKISTITHDEYCNIIQEVRSIIK